MLLWDEIDVRIFSSNEGGLQLQSQSLGSHRPIHNTDDTGYKRYVHIPNKLNKDNIASLYFHLVVRLPQLSRALCVTIVH